MSSLSGYPAFLAVPFFKRLAPAVRLLTLIPHSLKHSLTHSLTQSQASFTWTLRLAVEVIEHCL
jgi:hypothetical protein